MEEKMKTFEGSQIPHQTMIPPMPKVKPPKRVERPTKEGYIETLKAAADEINRRAGEIIGELDYTKGYEITINVDPDEIVTIVTKKTMCVPKAVV
jgi:hypothetical protein